MKIGHHHPRSGLLQTQALRHREHGYILVMSALLLVPLLLIAGLSVDIGSWYSRASDIQKAADAAALAGVVWLPDVPTATSYALATAKRNGFEDGVNGIDVSVDRIGDRRLRVTITDPRVGSFFYQNLGGRKISLSRRATGEYVLPVPLGSPDNHFGNDPLDLTYTQPNLWGNIHGPRTDDTKGDAYAPQCDGADNCNDTTNQNLSYRPSGYLYTVDVPAGNTGFDMQIYDAGLYDRGSDESVDTGDRKYTGTGSTTTTWTFYNADSTPLVVDDNPIAPTSVCSTGARTWTLPEGDTGSSPAATYKNKWVSICKNTGAIPAGQYLLRVQTSGDGSASNRYSLKALTTSTAKPRIAGFGDMSMFNNISSGSTSSNVTANFYLAEVDPIHVGKVFRINLYDPGEVSKTATTTGNGQIQVIAPGGAVATSCTATTDSTTSGAVTSGSILTPCQFNSAGGGNSYYNGNWITLDISIPTTYTCTLGTVPGCWWKIKYIINGQANDTTTWAAQVIGDPVHLVQE